MKYKVKTLDGLSETEKALYIKLEDGSFQLDVEGVVERERFNEFRTNNTRLQQQLTETTGKVSELQKRFEGVDPEAAREAQELQRKLREKELIEAGEVERALAERESSIAATYEDKLRELTESQQQAQSTYDGLYNNYSRLKIGVDLIDQLEAIGIGKLQPNARDMAVDMASKDWVLGDDGKFAPREGLRSEANPTQPMTVEEWGKGLVKSRPFLFQESQFINVGDGSGGGQSGVVSINDTSGLNNNLDAIASGKVRVLGD